MQSLVGQTDVSAGLRPTIEILQQDNEPHSPQFFAFTMQRACGHSHVIAELACARELTLSTLS